ncbi:MAG TPA: sigma-54 dependent transcriptional regulator [Candidatus Sumerlaeota bacterium]|nr:sigma-54 dependent transcriptional regulator [Candidatus Sumerlaeota bacterium]HNM46811.1 sigma-54 dependent transcriptional regulator [Candidatus Sumerlaeota bacterium]
MPLNLLLVDDQAEVLEGLKLIFKKSEHEVFAAATGEQAVQIMNSEPIDVVLTDLNLGAGMDGVAVLRHANSLASPPTVILLTAFGTIEGAVEALKEGAFNYLTKPVNVKELRAVVEKAAEHRNLVRENRELRAQIDRHYNIEGMVGETGQMQQIYEKVRLIAPTKASVLILGESGTGKEVLAKAIHQASPRARKPFVAVHCAALPEALLESELFGHERGAFTGAVSKRQGRFELASGGTIFLDEIGEIPLSMQVKLLRVLEAREIQRVGGNETISVDVRILAATNRDLSEEVAEGRFREDLFYRLNVVSVTLPPLRARRGDIPLLARHFLEDFARDNGREVPDVSREAMEILVNYHWPGNVRELRNIMENTFVFLRGKTILPESLPAGFSKPVAEPSEGLVFPLGLPLEQVETDYLKRTLTACDGNRTRAAESLCISRRTLQRRIKELGIEE